MQIMCSTSAFNDITIESFDIKDEFKKVKPGTCVGNFSCDACGNTFEICNSRGNILIMGLDKNENPINTSLEIYEKNFCKAKLFGNE